MIRTVSSFRVFFTQLHCDHICGVCFSFNAGLRVQHDCTLRVQMPQRNAFQTLLQLCINADLKTDEFVSASFSFADVVSGLVECHMEFFDVAARNKFAASLNTVRA